jgi:hypothetical protein
MIPVEEFLKEHERRAQSIATNRPSCDPAQQYAIIRDAANRRWRIFPVTPTRSWHASVTRERIVEATNNLVTLEELADVNPGCRWGLATGKASGVFVLEMEDGLGSVALNRSATIYIWLPTVRISKPSAREPESSSSRFPLPSLPRHAPRRQASRTRTHNSRRR